ncbi:MAG: NAD(P)-dependent oxidoreductase, partial [Gemmatimonadaceae bacterium]|nr:NAD(P)-dependent oxidoreductase [Gemmatimonadaceae bacterium]
MNALVTGGAGFVGQWLCRALIARGWSVWGTRVPGDAVVSPPPGDPLAAVHWVGCDVTRAADLRAALDASAPDAIFHLAGISFVPAAGADPGAAVEVNVVRAPPHPRAGRPPPPAPAPPPPGPGAGGR